MRDFTYVGAPIRVRFGVGTLATVADEVRALGGSRALVLTTPEQAADGRDLAARLGELSAGVFAGAVMHTPVAVSEQAAATAREAGADTLVALGGGSSVGLAKAIALRTGMKQVVVPTTYAGSEMTPILGQTESGHKTTLRSPSVLPQTVIYDVDLTLTLPPALSATSGLNAIAHAVEALYALDRDPVHDLMAEAGIAALSRALPQIMAEPRDRAARSDALYGAWLCASCLGAVGMSLHHKLCHTLGGTFDLPHAPTHAAVLPHALAYNAPAVPDACAAIARALGVADAPSGLYELARRLGVQPALRELGMPESGVDETVALVTQDPYWNPRPIEAVPLRAALHRAWSGEAPRVELAS